MLSVDNLDDAMTHFLRHYLFRLNVGLVMTITGSAFIKGGTGKSYAAIRIAESLDKDFMDGTKGMQKIVFTPNDFVRAVKLIEKTGRKGQVIIIDEAGIFINARQWQSMINRAMNNILMTFRTLHCMAIFITPTLSMMDKNARQFTNVWCMMEKVMKDGKVGYKMTARKLIWDMYNKSDRFWAKKIVMYDRNARRMVEMRNFWVSHPRNMELVAAYEKAADVYKVREREKIAEIESVFDPERLSKEILENPKLWKKSKDGRMRVNLADAKNWYSDMDPKEIQVAVRSASRKMMEAEV